MFSDHRCIDAASQQPASSQPAVSASQQPASSQPIASQQPASCHKVPPPHGGAKFAPNEHFQIETLLGFLKPFISWISCAKLGFSQQAANSQPAASKQAGSQQPASSQPAVSQQPASSQQLASSQPAASQQSASSQLY